MATIKINPKYKAQMNAELKNASSMADMFKILGEYYDLENCKPGPITKGGMIAMLQRGAEIVQANPKPAYR
jgi:hypothetical protein